MLKKSDTAVLYSLDLEERVKAWAQAKLEPSRLPHVEGVVETVDRLARRYARDDVMRARIAGWIHDAAKHWSNGELLDYARAHNLPMDDGDRQVPMLLHGIVAYHLANEIFGFDDPRLERASARHTTGAPGMSTLEKVVYLGDLIEPTRSFPGVNDLRADAERDLDTAMLRAVDITICHLIDKQKPVDPRALLLRNQLIESGVRYDR